MNYRDHQAPVWVIWALVAAFGVVQAVAWTIAGAIPRRPGVLAQVVVAWIVMLILASLATRRIGSLSSICPPARPVQAGRTRAST